MTHRISYTTPKGRVKNDVIIEAKSREDAESLFLSDWPRHKIANEREVAVI